MGVRLAALSSEPIDTGRLMALVCRPEAGAVTAFVGVVRNHDPQARGEVVGLHYTCHPSTPARLEQVVAEVLTEVDPTDECSVAVVHRLGELAVGEQAFVVAVSAPHRRLAFSACEQLVERVKAALPVWKQQFEADGSYTWSGL